jgi:hypothetical protein
MSDGGDVFAGDGFWRKRWEVEGLGLSCCGGGRRASRPLGELERTSAEVSSRLLLLQHHRWPLKTRYQMMLYST